MWNRDDPSIPRGGAAVVALLALAWITARPGSRGADIAVAVGYGLAAAFVLWVGARDRAFAERHPGYAWVMVGVAAFVSAVVLIRHAARDWHAWLLLASLVILWRGFYLERRPGRGG